MTATIDQTRALHHYTALAAQARAWREGQGALRAQRQMRDGSIHPDARLIAAAPDLLEHMQAIAGYSDAPHVDPAKALDYIRQTARAAIAKATGATS